MAFNQFLGAIGIILATVGSILAWFFLGQLDYTDRKTFLKGSASLTVTDPTKKQIWFFRLNIWLSRFGVVLIAIGGSLQLWSIFAPSMSVCEKISWPLMLRSVLGC